MNLEVRDPVVAAVAQRTALAVDGVARLHEVVWRPGARARRGRGVEVSHVGEAVSVTVRLVVHRGPAAIEVIRTVQRSVRDEVRRLTGLDVEVVVVVVDVD